MVQNTVGLRSTVTSRRLHPPQPAGLVHRPRLVDDLVAQRAVTLVTAPAGSGKTVLATDWAAMAAARDETVAWLSLEPGDDRPFQFWSAVLASLGAVASEPVRRQLDAFSPPMQGFEPRFIHTLCDALLDEPSVPWLVLDDVHRLTDADVLAGLDELASRADDAARLVMLGRTAPALSLPRLRLEGKLGEVTAADLAFTVGEARSMFDRSGADLEQARVEELVSWTEGWAAGLRLAAISAEDAALRALPTAGVRTDQALVSAYLFNEVLRHLPEHVQEFLVQTSAPRQLSPELAALLSGRPDAGEILAQLCDANVLVLRSGADGTWYRYHSLLRRHLLDRLSSMDAAGPARQHRVAAQWFAGHGEAVRAVEHATLAKDETLLIELVGSLGLGLVMSGQATTVLDAVGFPRDTEVPAVVAIVGALAALELRDLPAADEWLSVACRDLPDEPRLQAMRAAAIVFRAQLGTDVVQALEQSDLLNVGLTGDADTDLLVHMHRGPARLRLGDPSTAMADLEIALGLARRRGYDQIVLECLSQMSGMAGSMCDFAATTRWTQQAISFASGRGWADSPRLAYAYLLASWTRFQTGDEAMQLRLAELGVSCLDGVNDVEVEMGVRSMLALARFEHGTGAERLRAAEAFHALWQRPEAQLVSPVLHAFASPQEIKLLVRVGRVDAAEAAARRVEDRLPGTAEAQTDRALLSAARGDMDSALRQLAPVLDGSAPSIVVTTGVLAQVTAACLHLRRGAEARALELVRRALQWAAPNRFQRPFIDAWRDIGPALRENPGRFGIAEPFVTGLVGRFRDEDGAGAIGVALSAREQEVLDDLPSGMTVAEIADRQSVSVNTVKTHLRNVYAKLGVTSRGDAIRAARARGLL